MGMIWRPDRESNAGLILRRDLFYPLNYRGAGKQGYVRGRRATLLWYAKYAPRRKDGAATHGAYGDSRPP